jgi:hypothetical protein
MYYDPIVVEWLVEHTDNRGGLNVYEFKTGSN